MKNKYFKTINIKTSPFDVDYLSGLLWGFEISGITEENDFLSVFLEKNFDEITLDIKNLLDDLKNQKIINSYSTEESILEDQNWNEEWEKQTNVIKVSDKLVIKPTFREYTSVGDEIVLTIDPKMSFGTGEHQTTRLVLQEAESIIEGNEKVLDVGSGTGILAIAALKLGASNAVAVDNDHWCYDNAIENSILNDVQDKIKIVFGELAAVEESEFDLILANINKNILLEIRDELLGKLKTGGKLLLSGLLVSDEIDIKNTYESTGLKFLRSKQMDEWISLLFVL